VSTLGGERKAVQRPLIEYATAAGWEYVPPDTSDGMRGAYTSFLYRDLCVQKLCELNPDFMTQELAEEVLDRFIRVPASIEGSLEAWEYLKGKKTVFVPGENRERNVCFLDSDTPSNNTFQVTEEFSFTNGVHTIRPDVVFLINGIPCFLVEAKASHKLDGIEHALSQVRRYHRECPELLSVMQVYALTHLIRFYYSSTWSTSAKFLFSWKEGSDFESRIMSFFEPARCVSLLTDYILFTRADDELKKVILRPHQMRAVGKIVERSADAEKRRALVWHTQGSGKTYTMIVAAQKILSNPAFGNPTVLMLIDRNELEQQLFGHVAAAGFENAHLAKRKAHLQKLLAEDTRGLVISMIHKFDKMPQNINTRDNIFVLIDEAHRTTSGDLGNYLMGALPNATYLGFTGTPIDRTQYGKGTFVVFGRDDPPQGYLDKYSIAESIEDKTTLALHYALAPNSMLVDRETLEAEFLTLAQAEGVSDIDDLNRILSKAVNLRNMLKNDERIDKIAAHIADHYTDSVEPLGYKAFVVAVDREACARYKEALDRHLPPEYSVVVYSPGQNDDAKLSRYHLSDDEEKQVRKDFRSPEKLPKILIVTDKLLTGFDAPVLYAMYVDKPMRDHMLLQAIARVNRPYEDESGRAKPSGFVLDYVGILSNLRQALNFDSADIEGVVQDVQVLKARFASQMALARETYLPVATGPSPDKAVERAITFFLDEEARHAFYEFYRELADIYDIVSPDAFLRPYVDDMETLTRLYNIVRETYDGAEPIDGELSRKTARLVQEHTHSGKIRARLETYEIDERTLARLAASPASDTEKVFNMIKSIQRFVDEHQGESPYLVSIGERAERIAQAFQERQADARESLEELKEMVEEMQQARAQQESRNMSIDAFATYWILSRAHVGKAEDKAAAMEQAFFAHPHWKTSENQGREVRKKMYLALKEDVKDNSRIKELISMIFAVLKRSHNDTS